MIQGVFYNVLGTGISTRTRMLLIFFVQKGNVVIVGGVWITGWGIDDFVRKESVLSISGGVFIHLRDEHGVSL